MYMILIRQSYQKSEVHLHDGDGWREAEPGKIWPDGIPAEDGRETQDSDEDGNHHLENRINKST